MGSTESTEHKIPKSAYEEVFERHNRNTTNDVGTQHDLPSPLTIKQSAIITAPHTVRSQHLCSLHKTEQSNLPATNISQTKEKDPYNVTKEESSTPKVVQKVAKKPLQSIIKPPSQLNNLDDFITNWCTWKEQLSSFLTLMVQEKNNLWGIYFLHFMGPLSQEILNNLFFNKEDDKEDYKILMQKFDAFYKFITAVKSKSESTKEYIEKLKIEAAQNIKNMDEVLKEKIKKEIQTHCVARFVALAKSKLPHFVFKKSFNSLTLAEITFLWKISEESDFDNNGNCMYCGISHKKGNCPALGKQCYNCGNRNHLPMYCPGIEYITDCKFCGGAHNFKRCPAYGEKCSTCGKLHHFSWQCNQKSQVKKDNGYYNKQYGHVERKQKREQNVQQKQYDLSNLEID